MECSIGQQPLAAILALGALPLPRVLLAAVHVAAVEGVPRRHDVERGYVGPSTTATIIITTTTTTTTTTTATAYCDCYYTTATAAASAALLLLLHFMGVGVRPFADKSKVCVHGLERS